MIKELRSLHKTLCRRGQDHLDRSPLSKESSQSISLGDQQPTIFKFRIIRLV
jgi:hypothetical protein